MQFWLPLETTEVRMQTGPQREGKSASLSSHTRGITMMKVVPANIIPGIQLTAQQRIDFHDLMCDLLQVNVSQTQVDEAVYKFACEVLSSQATVNPATSLDALLWYLRLAWPQFQHIYLSADLPDQLRQTIAYLQETAASFDTANAVLQRQITQSQVSQRPLAEQTSAQPPSTPSLTP